jgi:hypothetical protein
MRADLANAGLGFLLGAALMLVVIVMLPFSYGPAIVPAMILGGAGGFLFVLRARRISPVRAAYRFTRLPRDLSAYELELLSVVARRRKLWLLFAVDLPYLGGLATYALASRGPSRSLDLGTQFLAGFLSAMYVLLITLSVQYLQVLWDLRRVGTGAGPERQEKA